MRPSLFSHEEREHGERMTAALTNQTQRKGSLTVAQKCNPQTSCLPTQQGNSTTNNSIFTIPLLPMSQSRLRTEFEVLMYLGKGAFGDVLKVSQKMLHS